MSERTESRVWFLACIAAAVAYVLTTPRIWQCEGVDEIEYLALAHSLLRGFGYTIYGAPHVLYPPLFASLLSVVMRFAGVTSWHAMYVMNAVLGVGGWILIGTWMRRQFGRVGRWAAWFLLLSYYAWSFPCRFLMTEPLFLPISFAALILAWRILERNGGRFWEYALLGTMCLLGGMTRAAAVSLNLALVLAGGVRWITTRRRAGLAVALLAAVLGVGFFAYWSIRADVVNPNAPESHWRWAKKYLGVSQETSGIIATGEEVTETSVSPMRRTAFWAVRYGQFITSAVRTPGNFTPLALLLAGIFTTGLAVHWRRRLWSPPAWYTAVFLGMILMTTWLSNYQRFLFVLAPFLFLFFLEGLRWWYRAMKDGHRFWPCAALIGVGVAGLVLTFTGPAPVGFEGAVQVYVGLMRVACALVYCAMIGLAVTLLLGLSSPSGWKTGTVLAVAFAVVSLQSAGLIVERFRRTQRNETLVSRNLLETLNAGLWLEENSDASAVGITAIPRLVAFLADRRFAAPLYDPDGGLESGGADYVLLTGPLQEVPAYRAGEEARLLAAVSALRDAGRAALVFEAGGAAVYRIDSLSPNNSGGGTTKHTKHTKRRRPSATDGTQPTQSGTLLSCPSCIPWFEVPCSGSELPEFFDGLQLVLRVRLNGV